ARPDDGEWYNAGRSTVAGAAWHWRRRRSLGPADSAGESHAAVSHGIGPNSPSAAGYARGRVSNVASAGEREQDRIGLRANSPVPGITLFGFRHRSKMVPA